MRGLGAFLEWRRVAGALALTMPPLLALPYLVNEFAVHVLTISAYYVILAASWNMLAGFTGQFSLAQHGFAALGAYGSGLLVYHLRAPLWLSIPTGVLAAGVGGLILGLLVTVGGSHLFLRNLRGLLNTFAQRLDLAHRAPRWTTLASARRLNG